MFTNVGILFNYVYEADSLLNKWKNMPIVSWSLEMAL